MTEPKIEPRLHTVSCLGGGGLHRMAYWEWGDAANPHVVVCVHGLSRQGRDFDTLARELSADCRVICPDVVGRGRSDRLADPMGYTIPNYVADMVTLVARLNVEQVDWVGTSMGGSIGLVAAAGALRGRIGKLVLNDNGPELAQAAIDRIRSYAGSPSAFATVSELEQYFRTVYKPYGYLTEAQWRHLTETSTRRLPDGRVTPHYDPAMVQQFVCHQNDYLRWSEYDSLDIPVLCLRGESSDLLLPETAVLMAQRGPRARVETIVGCGHAPALNVPDQLALVTGFLGEGA